MSKKEKMLVCDNCGFETDSIFKMQNHQKKEDHYKGISSYNKEE